MMRIKYLPVIILAALAAGYWAAVISYPGREFARTWERIAAEKGVNSWHHQTALADPASDIIVRPNTDTLYSYAAIDCDKGPLLVTMPAANRYWSIEIIGENTDVAAYVSSRIYGTDRKISFVLTKNPLPATDVAAAVIRCPGSRVWLVSRIVVDGPGDVAAVRRLQSGMGIVPAAKESGR